MLQRYFNPLPVAFRTDFVILIKQLGPGSSQLRLCAAMKHVKHEKTEIHLRAGRMISKARLLRCRTPIAQLTQRALCQRVVIRRMGGAA